MITIDGTRYDARCDIERKAEIKASELSGLMLNLDYFNDVQGTYMSYGVALTYPLRDKNKYAALFEILTEPVDGHQFAIPYNNSNITITARVSDVSDRLIEPRGGAPYWRELRFTITANHPSRAVSLGQAIQRGRAPTPDVIQPPAGTTYTWVNGRWETSASYADADLIAY